MGYTTDNIRQKFTSYERDDEVDLDFAQARYYNSKHGRFTTVDPLMASADIINPQTFNRYVYVGNNPVNITDSTGLQWGVNGEGVIRWFDGALDVGFSEYKALVGWSGDQLYALNPNGGSLAVANAAAAIQQIVAWGAGELAIAGTLSALGVGAVAAAAIAATIACGTRLVLICIRRIRVMQVTADATTPTCHDGCMAMPLRKLYSITLTVRETYCRSI